MINMATMLDKWSDNFKDWRAICDFFEWLSSQNIELAKFIDLPDYGRWHYMRPISQKLMDLFCEYAEIDQTQLESERRALLESVRVLNES